MERTGSAFLNIRNDWLWCELLGEFGEAGWLDWSNRVLMRGYQNEVWARARNGRFNNHKIDFQNVPDGLKDKPRHANDRPNNREGCVDGS